MFLIIRAIKRLFVGLGLVAEKATGTGSVNQAGIERGIRDSRAGLVKAIEANARTTGRIALLNVLVQRQTLFEEEETNN